MKKAYINAAQILTVQTGGKNYKRGISMNDIGLLHDHAIITDDGKIIDILPNYSLPKSGFDEILDVRNKIIVPGLIDCHTHTVFAGSRASEFADKIAGVSYEEIARRGGGIQNTMNATRSATKEELIELTLQRINYFITQGVTTLEIKSGYGLDFENEIKMLEVIRDIQAMTPIDIVPTFLGAHIIPSEFNSKRQDYINIITEKMIPFVAKENLAEFCDVFCEETAFTHQETDQIFSAAKKYNMSLKLHTEQFNNHGGFETALRNKVISIDHLEVLRDDQIALLHNSDIVAVLLPGVSFFLNYRYAPARKLIDADAIVAISTDFNPGSSNIPNMHTIMQFAATQMKMTCEEIISAVTINAAKAINRNGIAGSLEVGKNADFAIFNTNDYREIIYTIGKNLIDMTVKNGDVIYKSNGVH